MILKLLQVFNVPTWGVFKAKASECCGCSASCAGAGKSCSSGNTWRAESYRPHRIISLCHGSTFLPLSYLVSIVLQTTSGFGCKMIKGLEWCYKVLEILKFMPKPQSPVGTEGVEYEMEEEKGMGKQDVAQCSASFMVLFCIDLWKSTNLNWIWVPQGHHEWLHNH